MPEVRSPLNTTVADRTVDMLRQRILAQTPGYLPGERLLPLVLANELGVSATPVHQALERLAAEGLVESVPRRGTYVTQLSTDDVDDLASVRAGLELLAFRFRAGRLSADELAQLEATLDRCEQAVAADDHDSYRINEFQFHRLLVAVGRSRRLLALYESVLNQTRILAVYLPRLAKDMRDSVAEHRRLLEVLKLGELSRSEEALVAHWGRSGERIRRQFGDHLRTDHAEPGATAPSA
jgi:DNA-binding GntR family transcriptional regulator